tara:strand:+ start:5538 stop:6302 length:765 start_codon:yes stop_codon:yes gene_type:complete
VFEKIIITEKLSNKRLDQIITELEIVNSRNKAISLIMSGKVFVNEKKIEKPGKIIKINSVIRYKKDEKSWVSRGGIKLQSALEKFNIDVSNKICLDIGCSTGGFTEVLLSRDAEHIFSVDVGYGQFDWKLRNSKKITLFERMNIKNITESHIPVPIDIVVCDVSFISIRNFFLHIKNFLNTKFIIVSLIKPQFEARREDVGRGGIIKDPKIHDRVCNEIKEWFLKNFHDVKIEICESIIKGQKGNKEYFIFVSK